MVRRACTPPLYQSAVDEGRISRPRRKCLDAIAVVVAVGPGNGDPVASASAPPAFRRRIPDTRLMRGNDFRLSAEIALETTTTLASRIFGRWLEINGGAKLRQLLGHRIRRQVGAADLVTFVSQHWQYRPYRHRRCRQSECAERDASRALWNAVLPILCIHSLRHQLLYSGGENHRN